MKQPWQGRPETLTRRKDSRYNNLSVSGIVGIGRRAGFRFLCLWRVGSSPTFRSRRREAEHDGSGFAPFCICCGASGYFEGGSREYFREIIFQAGVGNRFSDNIGNGLTFFA